MGEPDESADSGAAPLIGRRRLLAVATTGMAAGTAWAQHGGGPWTGSAETTTGPTERMTGADVDGSERGADRGAPVVGANLNGRPRRLGDAPGLVDASETTWVRAFLDVREKNADGTRPGNDPDVVALGRAARRKNCKLLVSLQWDFAGNRGDKDPRPVPRPGSTDERELHRCAARYLDGVGAPVDAVVLGNEPMWETLDGDIRVDDPSIVRFTRDLKDHLVRHGDHGDPDYLVGAFNRINEEYVREYRFREFHSRMFELVRNDDDVAGLDLHVHYDRLGEAEEMVAVAREAVPDATITVSEFSPVWRYDRHKDVPVATFAAGRRFVRDHDLPWNMTPVQYFEHAKEHPRPPAEVADFYDAMPWYNVNHVEDVHRLFAEYGVRVGTMGFLQDVGMRDADWTTNWTPFHVNFLFQPALMRTEDGIESTAHPYYLEDYRERAGR